MSERTAEVERARRWLVNGGGGFEDGEDGIRACTMSAEHAIELLAAYARSEKLEMLKGLAKERCRLCAAPQYSTGTWEPARLATDGNGYYHRLNMNVADCRASLEHAKIAELNQESGT